MLVQGMEDSTGMINYEGTWLFAIFLAYFNIFPMSYFRFPQNGLLEIQLTSKLQTDSRSFTNSSVWEKKPVESVGRLTHFETRNKLLKMFD